MGNEQYKAGRNAGTKEGSHYPEFRAAGHCQDCKQSEETGTRIDADNPGGGQVVGQRLLKQKSGDRERRT